MQYIRLIFKNLLRSPVRTALTAFATVMLVLVVTLIWSILSFLDQATADLQKKKKAYDDAKAKRRDNILKQIADESFAAASTGAAPATSATVATPTSAAAGTSTAG